MYFWWSLLFLFVAICAGAGVKEDAKECCKRGCTEAELQTLHDAVILYARSEHADPEVVSFATKVLAGYRCSGEKQEVAPIALDADLLSLCSGVKTPDGTVWILNNQPLYSAPGSSYGGGNYTYQLNPCGVYKTTCVDTDTSVCQYVTDNPTLAYSVGSVSSGLANFYGEGYVVVNFTYPYSVCPQGRQRLVSVTYVCDPSIPPGIKFSDEPLECSYILTVAVPAPVCITAGPPPVTTATTSATLSTATTFGTSSTVATSGTFATASTSAQTFTGGSNGDYKLRVN